MNRSKITISDYPNPQGMKPSEYYEKYFLVDDGSGNMVHPRPLTQGEKDFLDNTYAKGGEVGILWNKKTRRLVLSAEALERKLEAHLPQLLKEEIDDIKKTKETGSSGAF